MSAHWLLIHCKQISFFQFVETQDMQKSGVITAVLLIALSVYCGKCIDIIARSYILFLFIFIYHITMLCYLSRVCAIP